MKILLVSNYQPPHVGGIEYAARSLKRCWEEDGHTVTWLAADIPVKSDNTDPTILRLPAWNVLEDYLQINSPIPSPRARKRIRHVVATHDVVNVHSLAPGISAVALHEAMRQRKPLVVTQHVGIIPLSIPGLTALQHRMIRRAAQRLVAYGAPLTFVGKAVRNWFIQEVGIPSSATCMTPAGVDPHVYHYVDDTERAAFRAKWKLADNAFNVLFVGRFIEKKSLPLIHAVAASTPDIHYTLVGSGLIRPDEWGLSNVTVIPYVEDHELRELYGAHDLFIMPSYGEGWPAVVCQAMCCGLPCLVSEETFAGYAADPDRFIVAPRSMDAVREALVRAAAGAETLIGQRENTSAYATATWNWAVTARIYLDLFQQEVNRIGATASR